MGRPALSDAQRTETRRRIRDAALKLYTEQGLDAVSIRSVAQAVGVAASGIYSYFNSRQALIEALWFDPVMAAVGEMIRVAEATPDSVARVERVLRVYIAFAMDNPEIYRGAFLFVRPDAMEPPVAGKLDDLPFHTILRDAIRAAQDDGRYAQGDADMLAQTLWAGLHGAVALSTNVEHWSFASKPERVESMLSLMLSGLNARK
jgi:AcrR family transcriptional regulator